MNYDLDTGLQYVVPEKPKWSQDHPVHQSSLKKRIGMMSLTITLQTYILQPRFRRRRTSMYLPSGLHATQVSFP
jgi:hypothetical protein